MDGLKSECLDGFRSDEVDGFVGIRTFRGKIAVSDEGVMREMAIQRR